MRNISGLLGRGEVTRFYPTSSLLERLGDRGFHVIILEKLLHIGAFKSPSDGLQHVKVQSDCLEISLNKERCTFLRSLLDKLSSAAPATQPSCGKLGFVAVEPASSNGKDHTICDVYDGMCS